MKIAIRPLVSVAALLASTAALAQQQGPEPEYAISYNIGAVSDYRVRGIAQTNARPAVQGGIDLALKSGLYVGTFASNVNWVKDFNGATKGGVEVDLYGGFRDEIADKTNIDVGIISYQYPGNNSGADGTPGAGSYSNASTTEVYVHLSYGIFNFNYNRSVGDFLGSLNSKGSQYFDFNFGYDLGNGMMLTPHIGHQSIPNQGAGGNQGNYTDYSLSLAKDFGNGLILTGTALATTTQKGEGTFYHDFNGRDLGKSTFTLGLKYNF